MKFDNKLLNKIFSYSIKKTENYFKKNLQKLDEKSITERIKKTFFKDLLKYRKIQRNIKNEFKYTKDEFIKIFDGYLKQQHKKFQKE
ncbi:MAG: hypothetical protein LBF02_01220 [Mycoplasmataceae bacterium]|jgi:hypothetical protein|nr:hypothetical protein [Mycoplasmataceae bacterium]